MRKLSKARESGDRKGRARERQGNHSQESVRAYAKKTIESRDREEQKKKPGKLKESLFLILPLFLSTLPSLVPRDARCARASRRDEVEKPG